MPRGSYLSNEEASVLTDLVRMYVGNALPYPAPSSGVYLNPDTILQRQTYLDFAGYDLYDQVELDPQVSAVLMTRKLAVAGLQWRIKPASDKPRDMRVAEVATEKLLQVPGLFQDLVELLDALGKGFAVSEVIWGVDRDGYVVPNEILNRQQRRFQFDATTRWLKVRKLDNAFYGDPVGPQKFIVHRNSQRYENPFGDALDQRLYWLWLFKRTVTKFWMNHAQSSSAPVPLVKIPAKSLQAVKTEALAVAEQIRSSAYGYIPADWDILWAESKNVATTADTYEKFIRWADEQIAKAVLGQTLTTEGSGSNGSGSRALGAVHNSVRGDIVLYDAKSLADTLSHTLLRWFCDLNFYNLQRYPSFEFVTEDSVDIVRTAQAIATLRNAGYKATREYVEKTMQIPLDEEEPMPKQLMPGQTVDENGQLITKDDDDETIDDAGDADAGGADDR